MENEFLKMMSKEQILKAFDEMMDFVKSDSPTAIDYLREIRNRYDAQPEIVRCKDCKWRRTNACFCKAPNDVQDNWFCSEGERKE